MTGLPLLLPAQALRQRRCTRDVRETLSTATEYRRWRGTSDQVHSVTGEVEQQSGSTEIAGMQGGATAMQFGLLGN